ncbi:MAG: Prolipoprotein diacylglyceryl transferase [Candidatus Uhrbacteria bacterium GW2011_GWF2_41_16]|uniref:Phosphatidylglycerol--prolipoprotein diacylglyceryl transferase n=2 Tax=Candidatus Uhriibacteriota TaxID=1752732 RepID=A0A0G0VBF7_9BACT|nr:MAG: Prolipoprotein diacylglyceryl transferase [Candidatus Uhrbacteria bacterium GW2011_GWC2_41_11]KKR98224.1 MAG: Prolipoprotein diacylglyceryl transferase [Candidatus Uhrbacteria bacterium GW2011_GWF2_41_16]HBP00016.1 prolipoprotein diacylglyceryl transferase [Candidatus Uhrbacteria bacterium]
MIPYIYFPHFSVGPLTIQVWGLMVALGFLIGATVSARMIKKQGLDAVMLWDLLVWILIASMVGARLFHILFYEPSYYFAHPFEIMAIWNGGMSSMGGFAGAVIASIWFLRRRHVDVWKYADAAIFGLPLGYGIGRIGCFFIHDHPGTATDFFLGIRYPDGMIRHDLGLYLFLNGFLLFAIFLLLVKYRVRQGMYLVTFLLWYGISRFFLDFLRATSGPIVDTRYLFLTPAQYASLGMITYGCFLFWKFRQKKTEP